MTKPAVQEVLRHLREEFPGSSIQFTPDESGGGDVIIEGISLGDRFLPKRTWIGAHLSPQLPYADIYPVFVGPDVTRSDGQPLGGPTAAVPFASRPAIQVSRRTNHLVATPHAAAMKFRKIVSFLQELAA